jgi:16S rRNA pseudouridine516 synthase
MLEGEKEALAPATLEALSPREARVTTIEGRYHQVRRMFVALGNHVEALRRERIGGLGLEGLAPGEWRLLDADARARLFAPD